MFVFKGPLFYFMMTPEHKGGDAGDLDEPKRSHAVLPFSEKVKVLDF